MKLSIFILLTVFLLIISLLYSIQEKFIFQPYPLSANYNYTFPFEFEELNWQINSEINLNALHFKTKDSKGVVLYLHGNGGNLAGWGGIAEDFLSRKYNLIIFDFRGYGKSTGKIQSEQDLLEDSKFAYEYTKSIYPENLITLYGRSLGSGLALYLAKENKPKRVILETPYNRFSEIIRFHYSFIPNFLIKYQINSEEMIGFVKCPIYIFHGTDDFVIPIEYAQKLEPYIKTNYNFYIIPNAGHNDVSETKEYFSELNKILR